MGKKGMGGETNETGWKTWEWVGEISSMKTMPGKRLIFYDLNNDEDGRQQAVAVATATGTASATADDDWDNGNNDDQEGGWEDDGPTGRPTTMQSKPPSPEPK